ncbi:MAG: Insulinase (Peptidase M16) [Alyxoria varia]|nr:MAG: Insulinase (Peptidase M16) [Alyxoria varia]
MEESICSRATGSECLADQLERPSQDDRAYRVIRLQNDLEALLIHDPDTDKASAALDVDAGSFSDEPSLPGMAHAVEHLLFMGTEKYPGENDYNSYLASHSGYSNAFTSETHTNFFFEVASRGDHSGSAEERSNPGPLFGALDRFAQFFIAPLFLEETLDRELKAVDSENKKNLQNDHWRLRQLIKSLSNPQHPYCFFSTGNLQTLRDDPVARGVRIRDEFMRFHREQYSANRMKLAVLGRESLDTLQEWVETLFSPVHNKKLSQNRWDGLPISTGQELGTVAFAKPVMDSRFLQLRFEYRDEDSLHETQPGHYLSHLIGHEGPGSLLAYLKGKGWANDLSAAPENVCPGSGLFHIGVGLTPEGLKNYEQVVKTAFNYLAILHETPPQEWVFDELKRMAEVDFRYKQKGPASSTTCSLSQTMQKPLPRNRLLSGGRVLRKFDAKAIAEGASLLKVENLRLILVSNDAITGETKREKWYGTEYSVRKLSKDFCNDLKRAEMAPATARPAELHMPHKNEFIPYRLEVEKRAPLEPLKAPSLIRNDEAVRLWYKKDDQFWVPKANVRVHLRNPVCASTPRTLAMACLFVELVQDHLNEYSYDAEIAGLAHNIRSSSSGIHIWVSGYTDKLAVLLEKLLLTMRDLDIKNERFDIVKERLVRIYHNSEYESPYHQIDQYASWLASEKSWISEFVLAELRNISVSELRAFHHILVKKFHSEALVQGNLHRQDAQKLMALLEDTLKPQALPASQWPIQRSFVFPRGSNFLYERELKDPSNVNHCIDYFLMIGDLKDRALHAKLQIFEQMTEEAAFDQLRTKEQLGYVVFSGAVNYITTSAYHVLVQSEKPPGYLETRIDAFLRSFKKDLADMTPETFESHKRSVINKRLQKLQNLNEECSRFWAQITSDYYNFEQRYDDVTHIKSLTKEDLLSFYNYYIDPSSESRSKLSIHLLARSSPEKVAQDMSPADRVETLASLFGGILTATGVDAHTEALCTKLREANVEEGNVSKIVEAAATYLKDDTDASAQQTLQITDQVERTLPTVLPQIGIQTRAEDHSNPTNEATVIQDVQSWKASLALGVGATPVRDLSLYEDLDPKL